MEMRWHRERFVRRRRQQQQQNLDPDWLGPHSANFDAYARHILKFFNGAIDAYTQPKYALQDLHQYIGTQRALSKIVNKVIIVNGERTFVFIGDQFTPANSPAKGYIRTKVRELVKVMQRHPLCYVYFVDEFRTTKLCSLCHRTLE